jgi:uncharacterized protein (TIGR04255 family)
MTRLPATLGRDPIVEFTFEIRFHGAAPSVAELLPGMLFPYFKSDFPRMGLLPASQIPKAIRDTDPNFAYQPVHVLEGGRRRILLAERAVALSVVRPYEGWASTRPLILSIVSKLRETGLVEQVERFSLRYMNVINLGSDTSLAPFKIDIGLGKFQIRGNGLQIQAEIERDESVAIIQLATGATIAVRGESGTSTHNGVMVAVDTVRQTNVAGFLADPVPLLEVVHNTEKEVFFGLLKDETIAAMEPVWSSE